VNNKAIVIPINDLYVLAVLNSRVMWWIVNSTFQHMKDEGLSVDVQFLKRLPVPVVDKATHTQIEETAHELIHSARTPGQSAESLLALETRLNELVLDAFQLTGGERQVMVMSLPPRDPVAVCENGVIAER
jgi:adenine-specific DNA-methyltransferase